MSAPEQAADRDPVTDQPSRGRRLVRLIWALGLLSLLGGSGYLFVLMEPQLLPVRVVTVDGAVKRLSPRQLQESVITHLRGGILTQNLAALKTAVEAMPWVRSANLRRHWPDRLELVVVEQEALARWGEDALVCSDGVVFTPDDGAFPRGLSKLSGQDKDARTLVEHFLAWGPRLRTLALEIEALELDARGAWTLRLSAGFTLALGTGPVEERISRFIRAYPTLVAAGMPSLVDMRYSNGLAIRWADVGGDSEGPVAVEAVRSAKLKSRASKPSRS